MKNILKISALFILILNIISCGNGTSKHSEGDDHKNEQVEAGDHNEGEETPNKVALKLNQLELLGIELGNVSQLN